MCQNFAPPLAQSTWGTPRISEPLPEMGGQQLGWMGGNPEEMCCYMQTLYTHILLLSWSGGGGREVCGNILHHFFMMILVYSSFTKTFIDTDDVQVQHTCSLGMSMAVWGGLSPAMGVVVYLMRQQQLESRMAQCVSWRSPFFVKCRNR